MVYLYVSRYVQTYFSYNLLPRDWHIFRCKSKYNSVNKQRNRCVILKKFEKEIRRAYKKGKSE